MALNLQFLKLIISIWKTNQLWLNIQYFLDQLKHSYICTKPGLIENFQSPKSISISKIDIENQCIFIYRYQKVNLLSISRIRE